MRTAVVMLVLSFQAWACRSPAPNSFPEPNWQQVPVTIELRLAKKVPAPGLTAAVVKSEGDTVYLDSKVQLANEHIARVQPVEQPDGLLLEVWLTKEGADRLAKARAQHIGDRLAILVNSEVVSAPLLPPAPPETAEPFRPEPDLPGQVRIRLPPQQVHQLAKAVSQTWPDRTAR